MKTYMFPGQGSQARGMGGTLFDEFEDLTRKADKILGYSIKTLCLEDPNRELGKTQFTQPALYVVNALSYYKRIRDSDERPDFLAGHSLGEYNALLAAECFDFETGLKLVKKRGELMSQATDGAMAAIVNVSRDKVEEVLREKGLDQVDVANYNTPQQIVISGPAADIAACQDIFTFDRAMYIPLNTSGAFHSRLMVPSSQKFEAFLKKRKFDAPKIPVIANLTAQAYPKGAVAEYLARQIHSTVLWSDTIQHLMSLSDAMEFVEVGHGDVLTKMIGKIRQLAGKAAAAKADAPKADAPKTDAAKSAPAEAKPAKSEPSKPEAAKAEPARSAAAAPTGAASDRLAEARRKIDAWNAAHPVGTKARSSVSDYGDLVTRTPATVLFGHRAAVYMQGYEGYFDLDEVEAV